MQLVFFFLGLLMLSAATVAFVSIASPVSLSVPTDHVLEVMSLVDSNVELLYGDPIGGNGGGGG